MTFSSHIRDLIARNELPEALQELHTLLDNSPKLDEAILQSARFQDIRKQIRLGAVSHAEATLTQNQIRDGVLDLLREIEEQEARPEIKQEVERAAISILHSKNVNAGTATAGGNIQFGDRNETHYHYGDRKIPRHLTLPPFIPPIFLGRDEELQAVHDRLFAGQHFLMLVNGQGGIGKTSFAAKYWVQYQAEYSHLAFLFVGDSIANALLSMSPVLGVSFPDTMPPEERLLGLLQHTIELQKPCLLVLDNANDEKDLEAHYPLLQRCANFHILITSRLTELQEAPSHVIGALRDDVALELFKTHYPKHRSEEDDVFRGIFKAVEGNTLVLEILAKNLREINQNEVFYPLSKLLHDLQNQGLLQLSEQASVKVHWQAFEKTTPEAIIGAMYDLRPLEASELSLLSNFAVLPPENISYDTLKKLLTPENPKAFSNTLTGLYRKGWIEKSDIEMGVQYKVSPVVQEIARYKNKGKLLDHTRGLIYTLSEKLEFKKSDGHQNYISDGVSAYAKYAESVVINEEVVDIIVLCERLGDYYKIIGDLEKALQYFEKFNQLAKELHSANPHNLIQKKKFADSYSRLGETYLALGNNYKSLFFFEKNKALAKILYKRNPSSINNKFILATALINEGDVYHQIEKLDKAFVLYEKSNQILNDIPIADLQNLDFISTLSTSYSRLGSINLDLNKQDKSIYYFEISHKLALDLYNAFPTNLDYKSGLAHSYANISAYYHRKGDSQVAIKLFNNAMGLFLELSSGFPQNQQYKRNLVQSYGNLGAVYSLLGNTDKALVCFEKCCALGEQLSLDYPQNIKYKILLIHSYSQLSSTQSILGKINSATISITKNTKFCKELYTLYPENVEIKYSYAISEKQTGQILRRMGRFKASKPYFENAYSLFSELFDETKSPKFLMNKQTLEIVLSTNIGCIGIFFTHILSLLIKIPFFRKKVALTIFNIQNNILKN